LEHAGPARDSCCNIAIALIEARQGVSQIACYRVFF